MTSWTDLEQYQELERLYQQALEEYRRREAAYEAIRQRNPSDPTLRGTRETLESAQQEVKTLWSQLIELRKSAASYRQMASGGGLS